ncbi:MAG: thioesterase [Ignavibacteriae bacterium]|nr:MAG: thioesterase [Ignavibacteriota bacterium]
MPRIKIKLPEKFIFKSEIDISVTDLNYGGHLGNDAVLSIAHEARLRFLKHLGYSELDVEGSGIIMSDAAIQYKGEGFHGDELIIEISVNDFTKTGCDFVYRLANKDTQKIIALVKTGIVFYDYNLRKVVSIPKNFIDKIESL